MHVEEGYGRAGRGGDGGREGRAAGVIDRWELRGGGGAGRGGLPPHLIKVAGTESLTKARTRSEVDMEDTSRELAWADARWKFMICFSSTATLAPATRDFHVPTLDALKP